MTARNVADRIGHGDHRQAECERNACEADSELGKRGGEHRRTATAQNQPTRTEKLSNQFLQHERLHAAFSMAE